MAGTSRRAASSLLRALSTLPSSASSSHHHQIAAWKPLLAACSALLPWSATLAGSAFIPGSFAASHPFSSSRTSDEDGHADYHGSTGGIYYPPPSAHVGQPAPDFTTGAVVNGELGSVSLRTYREQGKYVVLFFYPKDFTFVCPTEIIAFSDRAKEFEALNAQLIAASTDTEECHLAWIKTPRNRGGLGYMQIPIIADTTKAISAQYGVLIEKLGIALRGLFIINPEGVIQHITINDLPIGRNVDEALRVLQAIQFVKEHGEVCPANWKPGEKTMVAKPEESLEYFSSLKESSSDDGENFGGKLASLDSKSAFEKLIASGKPTVIDFYASWCGKCRQIAPFVEELQDKYSDVQFAKLDTSLPQLEAMSGELGVKALPTFRFYKDGKEVLTGVTGYKKKPLEEGVAALAGMK